MAAFDPTPSQNVWLIGYTEPHRQVLCTGVPTALLPCYSQIKRRSMLWASSFVELADTLKLLRGG